MITFVLAFLFIAIMIAAMAVGVIVKGKPIKGSCGGMAALNMDTACDICGGDTKKCDEEQERLAEEKNALAYDATHKK
ncbi:(Na+)-NQR maturation NqrM [Marinagarivorans cellulosilyticus]|uniref:(Na+)-NQR maturation NqrM n=1 Tax=Marinagarivorans cellulosilyticus TaxID=2721545 RepID=A0AAN1WFJ7_9GAMM|nr:(Na+)-NQR maturation NqrM [Marinagarivorans cellulosilyticus]BCD96682.1 hypothetical protein MARGE09_P0882 [Marinagarivorans cellulosilyticus]